MSTKPTWVIDKERTRRSEAKETVWLFGLHAVRDALLNPRREKIRLVVTKNAFDRLEEAIGTSGMEPEIVDPRKFDVPIDEGSVHQGAAMEVRPLNWGWIGFRRDGFRLGIRLVHAANAVRQAQTVHLADHGIARHAAQFLGNLAGGLAFGPHTL